MTVCYAHFSEIQRIHRKHAFKAVERKYFKSDPEPNMLTWSEKEQIRFLHNDNPSEWTVEKLAKSFPASPSIIQVCECIRKGGCINISISNQECHDHSYKNYINFLSVVFNKIQVSVTVIIYTDM